jgi:hypothetical protein
MIKKDTYSVDFMLLTHGLVEAKARTSSLNAAECLTRADDLVDLLFFLLYDS